MEEENVVGGSWRVVVFLPSFIKEIWRRSLPCCDWRREERMMACDARKEARSKQMVVIGTCVLVSFSGAGFAFLEEA